MHMNFFETLRHGSLHILIDFVGLFFRNGSKHAVFISGVLGNGLNNVPVLNDLTVLYAEDVNKGFAPVARITSGIVVHHHEIAFGDHTLAD